MPTTVVHKKHPHDVYIGRPSIWGNPFKIGDDGTREEVIEKYRDFLLNSPELLAKIQQLKGKTLGCYCKPMKCHGDVIVEILERSDLLGF